MNFYQAAVDSLVDVLDGALTQEEISNLLEKPKTAEHGDIAFPVFSLAKQFRKAPNAIAAELVEKMDMQNFAKVEVVGPYINFFLHRPSLVNTVISNVLAEQGAFGNQTTGAGRNVPIDMSSPNIAKPFSMGHLRSTVIGNVIANIYDKIGYTPIRINHLGDWGTQFGKLIVAYKKWGSEEAVKAEPIKELLKLYVQFHEEAENDPTLEEDGRLWFKKLETGDEEAQALWKWFRDESLEEFNKIYDLLGVSFDYNTGESFFNDKMDEVSEILTAKNLLTVDNGATIVDLEKYDLNPALIRKSDGASLYITRDLATALYRKRTFDFAQSLYVVGNEQSIHFLQLKAVLKEAGYPWYEDMHHIPFGLITQDGKKLSTRKGKVVLLEAVLHEAITSAKEQIQEKNPNLANKDEVAREVGVGAVVFQDLKNERLNSFDFNLKEVVRFEGETGPYVQYAHARCCSLLRKTTVDYAGVAYNLNDDESWEVVKLLNDFPRIVDRAAKLYEPSVIAKYTIRLAQAFNKYYAHTKVLEDNAELPARLAMVEAISIILKEGLRILGIKAPNEM